MPDQVKYYSKIFCLFQLSNIQIRYYSIWMFWNVTAVLAIDLRALHIPWVLLSTTFVRGFESFEHLGTKTPLYLRTEPKHRCTTLVSTWFVTVKYMNWLITKCSACSGILSWLFSSSQIQKNYINGYFQSLELASRYCCVSRFVSAPRMWFSKESRIAEEGLKTTITLITEYFQRNALNVPTRLGGVALNSCKPKEQYTHTPTRFGMWVCG